MIIVLVNVEHLGYKRLSNCFNQIVLREEREKYYKHRSKAKSDPERNVCIIIDGMDQMKLMIPQLLHQMKAYSSAWKLKTHLTGVLNHGREAVGFFDLHQWGHDSNLTINVLLRVLLRMDEIPERLYLQMDNCWRENKNQYVLTFLGVLVYLGIFQKVMYPYTVSYMIGDIAIIINNLIIYVTN